MTLTALCLLIDSDNYLITLQLSGVAAESLSKHQGPGLYLNDLTEISDEAAEALSKHQSELYLKGLSELSDEAAESLSKHKRRIDIFDQDVEFKILEYRAFFSSPYAELSDLSYADLSHANLSHANLTGVKFPEGYGKLPTNKKGN